jgi:tRNA nucleotidyltransferase (CCA-adding enzyme)
VTHAEALEQLAPVRRHPAVEALERVGRGFHLVGGVVRDGLLGVGVKDVDVVVAGGGEEVARRVAREVGAVFVPLGGKEFAAFRLVAEGYVMDVWDRGAMSLEDDLARRDFTVNSIALEPVRMELVDPFGGLGDLERRVLRATTAGSFAGDPLRVLRLARLAVQLPGFGVEEETVALGRQAAAGLREVAAERVREELALVLGHEEAHRGMALLVRLAVYPGLWTGEPGKEGGRGAALLVGVLAQLPPCVAHLGTLAPEAAAAVDLQAARLAATFAELPAAAPGSEPHQALRRFRDAGYVTRAAAEAAAHLLRFEQLPEGGLARRRFLHAAGPAWPTVVSLIGARAAAAGRREAWERELAPLAHLALREGHRLINPPRLLTGEEVQLLLHASPGPQVGRALAAVLAAQIEGRVTTKEEATALVRSLEL